jgi:hypothetical protein
MAGYNQTYEDLEELIVKDVYFNSQPREVQIFLKETGKLSLKEMTSRSEHYREAHGIFDRDRHERQGNENKKSKQWDGNDINPNKVKFGEKRIDPNFKIDRNSQNSQNKPDRRCFGCNSTSHIMQDCPKRGQGHNLDHRPPHHRVAACHFIHQIKIDGNDNEWNERVAELPTGYKLTIVAALTEDDADRNVYLGMMSNM